MPLARISHTSGKSDTHIEALSQGVHQALISAFEIPEDDYFQILTEHAAGRDIKCPDSFLGIDHGEDVVFVQITSAEGRTTEQKRALFSAIAGNLEKNAGIPCQDVIINIIETKRENWSFGNGIASFA